ncbi:MAG: HFLK protein [Clostridia bacterium]|nr:HFLK protein [Clostridia bacterium]
MKNGDYGYFGKGVDGYIRYMQFFNETQKGGGGGGRKPSSNGGCLTSILYTLAFIFIVIVLFTY